jgi:hypothetical protein
MTHSIRETLLRYAIEGSLDLIGQALFSRVGQGEPRQVSGLSVQVWFGRRHVVHRLQPGVRMATMSDLGDHQRA